MTTLTTAEPQALTTAEQQTLETHEQTIARGIDTFVEVGNALAAIRADRLYRAQYATFEDYARERWEIGRQRAYQLMGAAAAVAAVSTIVDTPPPANEAQARPLAGLAPEQQREVWKEAVKTAPGGKPTAAHVAAVADKAKGKPAPPPPPPPPVSLTPRPAPAAAARGDDEEIAAPPPPPLLMTPLAPAAPAIDRKQLAARRALLASALALVEAELAHQSATATIVIVIHEAQAEQAARMFLSSPALNAAAAMLAFSAREEAAA